MTGTMVEKRRFHTSVLNWFLAFVCICIASILAELRNELLLALSLDFTGSWLSSSI